MASGRSPGSGARRRGGRSETDALRRLAQLSDLPPAGRDASRGRVPNEEGLKALGDRVNGGRRRGGGAVVPSSNGGAHRRVRRRWSTKRRIFTVLGIALVLLVAVVGGGYLYLQYEWSKVQKVNCTSCTVPVASAIAPFNVLIIGSDTRAGNTGQAAKSFGTEAQSGGQRSDTIKVLHVDPQAGTADLLSIPRDTWVEMSGVPASTGLAGAEKINTAFNGSGSVASGINALTATIENTFGIPIDHTIVIDFQGLINAVGSVGGISMNFPYPVRDCSDQGCYIDNSGLDITTTGCQQLNGNQVLALARSRFFQYDDPAQGGWTADGTGDIGRIERQNLIIDALIEKVESTYNPLTLHSFLDSVVHDITIDNRLGLGTIYELATKYHAFSASRLVDYTLPTVSAQNEGGDVQIVSEPSAQQMLTQFLGSTPNTPTTPPLDVNDDPMSVSATTAPSTSTAASATTATTAPSNAVPFFDPRPC
jgi:LCP family protein required for cell wall assembly